MIDNEVMPKRIDINVIRSLHSASERLQESLERMARQIHPADPEKAAAWMISTFTPAFLLHAAQEDGMVKSLSKLYEYDIIDRDYRDKHIT